MSATEAAAPANTPATPAPEAPKIGTKEWRDPVDAKLAAIKAKLNTAPPEKKPEAPPVEAKDDKKPGETPKEPEKPATLEETRYLKEVAKLNRELRETKAKLRAFEEGGGSADEAKKLRELYKSDKLAALGELSGRTGTDELSDLLDTFYEIQGSGGVEAKDKASAAVLAKLEALTAEIEGFKAEKTERETASAQAAAKAGADEYVRRFAQPKASDYEISLRADNLAEATDLVHAKVAAIVQREGIDPDDLKDEDLAAVVLKEAWDETEAELIKRGERYARKAAPAAAPEEPKSPLDKYPSLRRSAAPPAEVAPIPKTGRFEDRFEAIKARARATYAQRVTGK